MEQPQQHPPSTQAELSGAAARLVEAGIEVIDALPLAKIFAGATAAKIAEAAGVTTGSFFHHFRNASEFADAIALSTRDEVDGARPDVDELLATLATVDLVEVFQDTLQQTWAFHSGDESIRRSRRIQLALWAHHDQPLSREYTFPAHPAIGGTETLRTIGDVIASTYRSQNLDAEGGWGHLIERTGRTVQEPFTLDRTTVALTAMFDGLLIREQVDPGAVDDRLFADIATALALATTVPRGGRVRLSDLDGSLFDQSHLSPQARSGVRRRLGTRRRIADAATGMFEQGWENVSLAEIAEVADVASQTVANLFGSVRSVAAATFSGFVVELRAAAAPQPGDTAEQRMRRTLVQLSECVAADSAAARALLSERLHSISERGSELTDMDIRLEVPIAEVLIPLVYEMGLDETQSTDTVSSVINFVLAQSIGRPNQEARTAELAMRLITPDEPLPFPALVSTDVPHG